MNESEYSCEFKNGVVPEMPISSVCVSTNSDLSFLPDCMSNCYVKILRIFSYVLRFVNVKKSNVIVSGPLCASELNQAENRLVRMVQGDVFSAEIRDLQCQKGVLPNSKLKNLNPFLDRGKCAKLYSDNGKTFVGANQEIKGLLTLVKETDEKISGFLSAEGIEWKFIPPRAPSFGGLWKSAVKSAKYHLKRIVGRSNLTYEEFLTVRIQIEGILNSLLLCPLSSSADDLNALTPANFLIGRSMNTIIEPSFTDLNESVLKRWQRVTRLVQCIWNKWHREAI
ncbi:hypothetical protein AVEN_148579-1 [Araneus ventricosus]|uniref:Integrase catalytic domain-containing protein n=1 Tax=Araneus ventricosus TaxID=182803 RepID=A0A4Y2VLU9_ARAVE|nr:hypothetical protein AVEN_148579-1 [Araneus ventricosus]